MKDGTYQVNLKGKELTDECEVFDSLDKKGQISEIDLSENLLSVLPPDLSKYKELKYLDLSGNQFRNYQQIGNSLSTLPKLAELKIDLEDQQNALTILGFLPNLMYLNGKSTKIDEHNTEESEREKEEMLISTKKFKEEKQVMDLKTQSQIPKEIEAKTKPNKVIDLEDNEIEGETLDSEIVYFNSIIQKIVLHFKNSKEKTDKFYSDFQTFLKKQIEKINRLIDQAVPNFLYSVNVCNAKLDIYGYLRKEIYPLLKVQRTASTNNTSLIAALNEIEDHTSINQKLINDLVTKISPRIQTSIKEFKDQSEEKESQISIFQNQITNLKIQISSLEKSNKENVHAVKAINSEKANLLEQIKLLREENKKITNSIIQKAREIQNTHKLEEDDKARSDLNFKTNQSGLNVTVGPLSSRIITKKNLLEIIEEIYKSKELYDKKCAESHLAKETLEQHMYTYLNQKYGLKKLIIEWATSIINGIKQYSTEDSEICLFGKILRNELEENIVHVLRKLKTTLKDLIVYCIENKYSHKEYNEILDLTNQAIKGYIDEDIWNALSDLLFSQGGNDSKLFKQKVMDFIMNSISKSSKSSSFYNPSNKKYSREEKAILSHAKPEYKILYQDFFRLLLDFQIRVRSQYLKNFVFLFRSVDKDLNGVLNEEQFRDLIRQCEIYSEEEETSSIERLLDVIDPYNKDSFTFSEIISTLEKEQLIDSNKNRLNALDKIAMNDTLLKQS